jgi:hypothetical protein
MLHDRFIDIVTMLHVNNEKCLPRHQQGYDPLCKIDPILNKLTKNFQDECTQPSEL